MKFTALVLLTLAAAAQAQTFPIPGKPVRIVVPFPPGGQTDVQARAIAQKMSESLGAPVFVENKPGGSTIIGAREVQKAAPDGHTLLYTIAIHVQLQHLYGNPPWDAFRDFTPITTGARAATVLTAHMSAPFNTVGELVAFAKANPGKLNYASFGAGTTSHLNGELFKRLAGIDIVHVPYKGSGDAMKDHLTGAVQLFFDGSSTALSNVKTGRVKLVAWAAETRNPAMPELPTMRETGYDVGAWGFLWFWGPAAMPAETLASLYGHLSRAIGSAEVKDIFAAGGAEALALPPAEAMQAARALDARWGNVIRTLGVKLD